MCVIQYNNSRGAWPRGSEAIRFMGDCDPSMLLSLSLVVITCTGKIHDTGIEAVKSGFGILTTP